jgi:hypothetical protein
MLAGLAAANFSRMDPVLAYTLRYLDERQFDEQWATAEYRNSDDIGLTPHQDGHEDPLPGLDVPA